MEVDLIEIDDHPVGIGKGEGAHLDRAGQVEGEPRALALHRHMGGDHDGGKAASRRLGGRRRDPGRRAAGGQAAGRLAKGRHGRSDPQRGDDDSDDAPGEHGLRQIPVNRGPTAG